ncbi:hypothetical protein FRC03_003129 [Tulasnella sp. 419]|nr:hypothetical protein FRC03_003129 [Tulasnella sp. 419]
MQLLPYTKSNISLCMSIESTLLNCLTILLLWYSIKLRRIWCTSDKMEENRSSRSVTSHYDPCAPTPIASLPAEILVMIFQVFWDRRRPFEYEGVHYLHISRCSKVCQRWRPIAQEILFRVVHLRLEMNAQSFLVAIRRNPSLSRVPRILYLYIDPPPMAGAYSRVLPQTTYHVTSQLPCLYHLSIQVPYVLEGRSLEALLHPQTFGTLRALSLNFKRTNRITEVLPTYQINLQSLLGFLARFGSLSHLHLENVGRLPQPGTPLTIPHPPTYRLLELGWHHTSISGYSPRANYFPIVVDWLFRNSPEDARILYFFDCFAQFETDNLHYFLQNYGKNLASLRLPYPAPHLIDLPFTLREMCPNLRELILPQVRALPKELRITLPESKIEHLWFAGPAGEREIVRETIEWAISLPNLRRITFDRWHGRDWAEMWEERRISRVDLDSKVFGHESKNDDLIWTSRFPRGRTIGNFRYMLIT